MEYPGGTSPTTRPLLPRALLHWIQLEEFDRKRQNQESEGMRRWTGQWPRLRLKLRSFIFVLGAAPRPCSWFARSSMVLHIQQKHHWQPGIVRSCFVFLLPFLMSGPIRTVHRLALCAPLLLAMKAALCMVQKIWKCADEVLQRSLHARFWSNYCRICSPSFESRPFLWLHSFFTAQVHHVEDYKYNDASRIDAVGVAAIPLGGDLAKDLAIGSVNHGDVESGIGMCWPNTAS